MSNELLDEGRVVAQIVQIVGSAVLRQMGPTKAQRYWKEVGFE